MRVGATEVRAHELANGRCAAVSCLRTCTCSPFFIYHDIVNNHDVRIQVLPRDPVIIFIAPKYE